MSATENPRKAYSKIRHKTLSPGQIMQDATFIPSNKGAMIVVGARQFEYR